MQLGTKHIQGHTRHSFLLKGLGRGQLPWLNVRLKALFNDEPACTFSLKNIKSIYSAHSSLGPRGTHLTPAPPGPEVTCLRHACTNRLHQACPPIPWEAPQEHFVLGGRPDSHMEAPSEPEAVLIPCDRGAAVGLTAEEGLHHW